MTYHHELPVPSQPPDSGGCVIYVNPDWLAIMAGGLEEFLYPEKWEGTEEEKLAAVDNVLLLIRLLEDCRVDIYPQTIILPVEHYELITGDQWTLTSSIVGTVPFQFLLLNNTTPAVNDEISWTFDAPPGDYGVRLRYVKSSVYGIMKVTLGTDEHTVDCYAASFSLNSWSVGANDYTHIGGELILKIKVTSKNASSTGYYIGLFDPIIYRSRS